MEWLEANLWIGYITPFIGVIVGSIVGLTIGETIRILKG